MQLDRWEHLVLVLHRQNVNHRLQQRLDHMQFTKVVRTFFDEFTIEQRLFLLQQPVNIAREI